MLLSKWRGNYQPYVSLARLFFACHLSPLQGLLRFRPDPLSYSLTLAGLAPFPDLWVPLALARQVAEELGRDDELAALLDWETRAAWSVEDKEVGGVVHNWKIGANSIDPQEYSTALMLSTPFPRVHLLPTSRQIRTLLPPASSFRRLAGPEHEQAGSWDAMWGKLVEWSVRVYEGVLEREEREEAGESADEAESEEVQAEGEDDLAPFFAFTTLSSLLHHLSLLPSSTSASSPPSTLTHLGPSLALSRAALLPSSSSSSRRGGVRTRVKLSAHLCDALSRLALHSYATVAAPPRRSHPAAAAVDEGEGEGEATLATLEARLAALEAHLGAPTSLSPSEPSPSSRRVRFAPPPEPDPLPTDTKRETGDAAEVRRLRRDLRALERVVDRLAAASTASAPAPGAPPGGLALLSGQGQAQGQALGLLVAAFVAGVAVGVALTGAGGGGGVGMGVGGT
ncbi:hypothetical protein JCM10207_005455 [Rhodosporidiobolus poonsookiae]